MTWLEEFLNYSRKELWEIESQYLFTGADAIADIDRTLFAYGSFKVDFATQYASMKLGEEITIDPRVKLDHEEHKNFEINYVSTFRVGGRDYSVMIDSDQCYCGKICESPDEFDNEFIAGVRSLLKNYFHVQNHIKSFLDEKAYNPAKDFRPEPKPLDGYLKG